jgi:hypothetical protein
MSEARASSNTGDVGAADSGTTGSADNSGTAETGGTIGIGGTGTGTAAGGSIDFDLEELNKDAESIGGGTMEEPGEVTGATG